jgi:hypothetical protein
LIEWQLEQRLWDARFYALVACHVGNRIPPEKIFPSLVSDEKEDGQTDADIRSFQETTAAFLPYLG